MELVDNMEEKNQKCKKKDSDPKKVSKGNARY